MWLATLHTNDRNQGRPHGRSVLSSHSPYRPAVLTVLQPHPFAACCCRPVGRPPQFGQGRCPQRRFCGYTRRSLLVLSDTSQDCVHGILERLPVGVPVRRDIVAFTIIQGQRTSLNGMFYVLLDRDMLLDLYLSPGTGVIPVTGNVGGHTLKNRLVSVFGLVSHHEKALGALPWFAGVGNAGQAVHPMWEIGSQVFNLVVQGFSLCVVGLVVQG